MAGRTAVAAIASSVFTIAAALRRHPRCLAPTGRRAAVPCNTSMGVPFLVHGGGGSGQHVAALSTCAEHDVHARAKDGQGRGWQIAGAATALMGTVVGAALFSPPAEAQSPASTAEARSSKDRVQELLGWLQARGCNVAGISIAAAEDGTKSATGLGVYATGQALPRRSGSTGGGWLGWLGAKPRRQLVATFPVSGAVTAQAALQQHGRPLAELVEAGVVDEAGVVMLHLVLERLRGSASPLAPYIAALPTHFDTPLFYTSRDLRELRGTPLHGAAQAKQRQIAALWARLQPALVEMCAAEGIAGAQPTIDDLMWAYSVYWSRALSLPVLTGEQGPEGEPVVEMRVALMKPGDGPGDITLWVTASKPPPAGTEIAISYGDKSNEELLFAYGFTEEGNPHDRLMVHCPVPPQDTWDETMRSRMLLLMSRSLSPQLFLPLLPPGRALLQLPDEAWDTLEGRRMAVLSTLVRLLEMRVEALEGEEGTGPLEADLQALADGAVAPKLRHALVYRAAQKRMAREYLLAVRAALQDVMRELAGQGP
eukprot:jgi/Tetstr1/458024/TSEL_044533.t1